MDFDFQELQRELDLYEFPPVIWLAVPLMFFFISLEAILSHKRSMKLYDKGDFWGSVGVGLGNLAVNWVIKGGSFLIVFFFYKIAPYKQPPVWWSFALCFVAMDFLRYWIHRLGHESRLFWSSHMTHHSSEYYNFAVSFRLSWVQFYKFLFFLPISLLGFNPVVFFITHQLAVLYQFWLHTELIGKLPWWIEYFFVTPSHHRVHHGRNPKYLDRNYGSTLIIWDRMFGTFQEEEERPDYGVTKPLESNNPVKLVFTDFVALWGELKVTPGVKEKLKLIFGRPK